MAIEDNKVYGLTGAQLKELPGKVDAVKGVARELTAADYNYPTSAPDGVAIWLLPDGVYTHTSPVKIWKSVAVADASTGGFVKLGTTYYETAAAGINGVIEFISATGQTYSGSTILTRQSTVDNLTSTDKAAPLSANQGKVLKGLIDNIDNAGYQTKEQVTVIAAAATEAAIEAAGEATDAKLASYTPASDLATVATTGSYNDLTDRPSIDGDINEAVMGEASARQTADATLQANITSEASARQTADAGLQSQIDAIVASSDVVDIVNSKADLDSYDTSELHDNDIVKVLSDETHLGAIYYYRWSTATNKFDPVGSEGPYYTKAETDTLLNAKANSSSVYTKTEMDTALEAKADATSLSSYATTEALTNGLAGKADSSSVYTKTQVDTALNAKANTSALSSYATTTALNNGLAAKADASAVYTKTEMDSALDAKADAPASGATYVTDSALTTALESKADISSLATVATSGKYSDLTGTPTIPTVNNATLTIQKNGSTVKTFTANSASNVTANITVPTKTSELTNDSSYATSTEVADAVSGALEEVGEDYVAQSNVVNNVTTTDSGKVLDARQGKALKDLITALTIRVTALETKVASMPTITMTTTDPGEGATLAANNFVGVYS